MTTLASNITADQTLLPVDAGLSGAIDYPLYYTVGSESVMVVGGAGGKSWSVVRGAAGTTAASHTASTELTRYYPDAPASGSPGGPVAASAVTFDNDVAGLPGDPVDVQEAIEAVDAKTLADVLTEGADTGGTDITNAKTGADDANQNVIVSAEDGEATLDIDATSETGDTALTISSQVLDDSNSGTATTKIESFTPEGTGQSNAETTIKSEAGGDALTNIVSTSFSGTATTYLQTSRFAGAYAEMKFVATDVIGWLRFAGLTAPIPNADLDASTFALSLDDTNGAAKLLIKGKSADGTVVTGSVNLT